jgi:hypothetical protein
MENRLGPSSASPASTRRFRALLNACLLGGSVAVLSACSLFTSTPPTQRGEPQFSKCLTGRTVEKYSNCGEYCASQNLGCQQYGCTHPSVPGKRWGGMSFNNELCTGAPTRSYQCNDPFVSDGAVECCCVGQ